MVAILLLALSIADPGRWHRRRPATRCSSRTRISARVSEVRAAFDALPEDALVVVAMDADLGTYAEIRPAMRAALDDLVNRGVSLAFVSVTIEGRAIAAAELARLRADGRDRTALLDLGFVSGVEAGLVRLVDDALPAGASGPMADAVTDRWRRPWCVRHGRCWWAVAMSARAHGSSRSAPACPRLPMVAMAPTFAQPELAPYLRTGQLVALLATVRDDAAYVENVAALDGDASSPTDGVAQRRRPCCWACWWRWPCWAEPWSGRSRGCARPAPRPAAEDDDA